MSQCHIYMSWIYYPLLCTSRGIFFFNWFPFFFRFQVLRALTLYKSGLFVSSLHCLHVFCHLTLFKSAWPLYVIFSGALTLYKSGPIFIHNITYHFTFHKLFLPYCFSMYFIEMPLNFKVLALYKSRVLLVEVFLTFMLYKWGSTITPQQLLS